MAIRKQGAETRAHVASPGMFAPQPHPLHALLRQLDPSRDRPHFLDEPDDPIPTQTGSSFGEPLPRPDQHIVRQLHQQDDDRLSHQASFADDPES